MLFRETDVIFTEIFQNSFLLSADDSDEWNDVNFGCEFFNFSQMIYNVVHEFMVLDLIILFIPSDEKKLNQNRPRNGKVRVVL